MLEFLPRAAGTGIIPAGIGLPVAQPVQYLAVLFEDHLAARLLHLDDRRIVAGIPERLRLQVGELAADIDGVKPAERAVAQALQRRQVVEEETCLQQRRVDVLESSMSASHTTTLQFSST